MAADQRARHLGIREHLSVEAALARAGSVRILERRPELEQQLLGQLATSLLVFTPRVCLLPSGNVPGKNVVGLEISGTRRLHGAPSVLCAALARHLEEMGISGVLGVAPTALGACWLARARVLSPGSASPEAYPATRAELGVALDALPLEVLGVPQAALERLRGLGLRTLGECRRLPRAGLARRIPGIAGLLDAAYGVRADVHRWIRLPDIFREHLELPGEVEGLEGLSFPLNRLVRMLEGWLGARGLGVRELVLELGLASAPSLLVTLSLMQATRSSSLLLDLLRERLERVDPERPVATLTLEAKACEPLAPAPGPSLLPGGPSGPPSGGDPPSGHSFRAALERLRARLGSDAVHGLALEPDHRPEHAWRVVSPGDRAGETPSDRETGLHRPLLLLPRPLPLEVRGGRPWLRGPLLPPVDRAARGQGRVRGQGPGGRESVPCGPDGSGSCGGGAGSLCPERIESGWWDGEDVSRDYHVLENPAGERYWIYEDRRVPGRWYLHGIFS